MLNETLRFPGNTVTAEGTLATTGLLLESDTVAPNGGGALLDKMTAPCEPDIFSTGEFTTTLCRTGRGELGVTVSVAVLVVPLYAAVMVIVVLAVTGTVVIVNVPVKLLSGASTVAGTLATAGLLLDSAISAPPNGAPTLNTTVPLERSPPTTNDGFVENVDRVAGGGAACGVKHRTADHGPATPTVLTPRTRQNCCVVARPVVAYINKVVMFCCSRTSGALKAL